MVLRWLGMAFSVLAYVSFVLVSAYAVGFLENRIVPKSIDSGIPGPTLPALVIDLLLLGFFALQHSVMARPAFKAWWMERGVAPSLERSVYVLLSSLALGLLCAFWQPLTGLAWQVQHPIGRGVLHALCGLGWAVVAASTFMISHGDLFGLRQAWRHLRGKPRHELPFTARALYGVVRHPIMLGFLMAFWASPDMSSGRLLFAGFMTAYVLIGIRLEERDLHDSLGATYAEYARRVPKLLPWR